MLDIWAMHEKLRRESEERLVWWSEQQERWEREEEERVTRALLRLFKAPEQRVRGLR